MQNDEKERVDRGENWGERRKKKTAGYNKICFLEPLTHRKMRKPRLVLPLKEKVSSLKRSRSNDSWGLAGRGPKVDY